MAFSVPGEAYDRFMGRYLPSLAPAFADAAGVAGGMRALDVGCGPGGLTGELVGRLGAASVAAVDPSPSFVAACRARYPGADVREGAAEDLPFADSTFDAALASLVVAFMRDAGAGTREMARVTRPGGVVAACMWDMRRMTMLRTFWEAAAAVDPAVRSERGRVGTKEGDIARLLAAAGLRDVEDGDLLATASYESFDDWWEPFTHGVGPAGDHLRSLDDHAREAVRRECRSRLGAPEGAFTLEAHAWFARARVPDA
jgi:ubiquinone/menaquinone biosynthesis C-methylase UbiE